MHLVLLPAFIFRRCHDNLSHQVSGCLILFHICAPPEQSRVYSSKVHCRIVFKEVGTSLYITRSLANVFRGLRDVIIGENCVIVLGCLIDAVISNPASEILHKYSWVHRDISPGNIMATTESATLSMPKRRIR